MNIRILTLIASLLVPTFANAGSATWNLNPGSGDWNTVTNWTPATVPNGSADTATFDLSNTTNVSISANTEVNGITFSTVSSAYIITANAGSTLTLSGTGITNNSGITQNFSTTGELSGQNIGRLVFSNNATAGSNVSITNDSNGTLLFLDSASAGSASISNVNGGNTQFLNGSTASNATILVATLGQLLFENNSTAGSATISTFDSSYIQFLDNSTAGNASIGGLGSIVFYGSSKGGTAQFFLGANPVNFGILDISSHNAPGVTVGSIEGEGVVFLGANNLTVGSNNLSTTFSGVIQDGGQASGIAGSLTKVGSGTLTLSGSNAYTGGTTVNSGTLLVNNLTGSATGTGAAQVVGGTLGGTGTIAGAVTVGTGSSFGAFISPGTSPGTLTIQSSLTLNSDATYKFELNSTSAVADKIVANGVTLNGAAFSFTDLGNGKLALGTTFVVIDNTSTSPIVGVFSNLADGSTFSINGNTYFVSYEGGTGNDLALTSVVPEPTTCAILILGAVLWSVASRLRKNSDLLRRSRQ